MPRRRPNQKPYVPAWGGRLARRGGGAWSASVNPTAGNRPADPTRPAATAQPNPPEFSARAVDVGLVFVWVCFLKGFGCACLLIIDSLFQQGLLLCVLRGFLLPPFPPLIGVRTCGCVGLVRLVCSSLATMLLG
jgi:hypothetical protein